MELYLAYINDISGSHSAPVIDSTLEFRHMGQYARLGVDETTIGNAGNAGREARGSGRAGLQT